MKITACTAVLFLGVAMAPTLVAESPTVPEPLRPWVPWVLEQHPDVACPRLDETAVCLWPGRLRLALGSDGGSFRLEVDADTDAVVELPGDTVHWPSEVTVDGTAALLRHRVSTPAVAVDAGRHEIAGSFRWARRPETLSVPQAIGIVELRLEGRDIARPRREEDGRLWLGETEDDAVETDRLTLAVHRLLTDGVPLQLETRIVFYVTGTARTVELANPLAEGFVATGKSGDLPARWLDGGRLRVRVRPGTWQLQLSARSVAPVVEIPFGEQPEPWPREEIWSFRAAPALRAVEIQGAPGIDPRRTALPEDWYPLPAYQLMPGRRLRLEELSRGVDAPKNLLRVARRIWLADDARGLAVEDVIEGHVYTAGRLEALAPGELGRARIERRLPKRNQYPQPSQDLREQVLTLQDETDSAVGASTSDLAPVTPRPGVNVVPGPLTLRTELVYPRGQSLPAVGWNHDAERLKVDLHLPLGWTLLAAWGADHTVGSWRDAFTVLDILLLLLIGFLLSHLRDQHGLDRRWQIALAIFFILSLHEPFGRAIAIAWLAFLPLAGRGSETLGVARRTLRQIATLGGAALLVVFAAVQWRTGFHPEFQLPMPWAAYQALAEQGLSNPAAYREIHPAEDAWWSSLEPLQKSAQLGESGAEKSDDPPRQVDLEEVVQTGFGIPWWRGKTCHLYWDGRVSADQEVRLWLVPPAVEFVLSMLRALAALALAAGLFRRRGQPPLGNRSTAAGAAVGVVCMCLASVLLTAPARAQEAATQAPPSTTPPSPAPIIAHGLLVELEQRLTRPPECHPACVEVPLLELAPRGDELRLTAEVHVATTSTWRLPGPAAHWTPRQVTIDGAQTVALRRDAQGFLAMRLPPGRHRVVATGPADDAVDLEMPQPPRRLTFVGEGWMLSGVAAGEPPPGAVRLDRLPTADTDPENDRLDASFDPWLELHRNLVIGLPWQVHSELRRRDHGDGLVVVRVPLLRGETVTSPDVTTSGDAAVIRLEPGQTTRAFRSQLAESTTLRLQAPRDQPWFERWQLDCSPVWSCRAEGLQGQLDPSTTGAWTTFWRPWPGEELTLTLSRPRPAGGPTSTVDKASFRWTPGRRHSEARLTLDVRTSVAGERLIRLPPAADLELLSVNDSPQAMRFENGQLRFTLPPGEHHVAVHWTQERGARWLTRPPVVMAGAVTNVQTEIKIPTDRRVLAVGGQGGPVIESWAWLVLVALAAVLLRRHTRAPLAIHEWLLLAVGILQLPPMSALWLGYLPRGLDLWWPPWPLGPLAFAVVAAWLVLSADRTQRSWPLTLLGGMAIAALGATIAVGFVAEPAAHIQPVSPEGIPLPTHADSTLAWYVDRAEETLPRPWVLWLPTSVWHGLVLLWAVWLASRLAAWSPWLWKRATASP